MSNMIKVLNKHRTYEAIEDIYTLDVNGKEVEVRNWSKWGDFTDSDGEMEIQDEDLLTEEEIDEVNDLEWWNEDLNPFSVGDKVRYKDGDKRIFQVYRIYSPSQVSLGLADYPDTEQDFVVDIDKIEKI